MWTTSWLHLTIIRVPHHLCFQSVRVKVTGDMALYPHWSGTHVLYSWYREACWREVELYPNNKQNSSLSHGMLRCCNMWDLWLFMRLWPVMCAVWDIRPPVGAQGNPAEQISVRQYNNSCSYHCCCYYHCRQGSGGRNQDKTPSIGIFHVHSRFHTTISHYWCVKSGMNKENSNLWTTPELGMSDVVPRYCIVEASQYESNTGNSLASHYYSLFSQRKPRYPVVRNAGRGFLLVNRLYGSENKLPVWLASLFTPWDRGMRSLCVVEWLCLISHTCTT